MTDFDQRQYVNLFSILAGPLDGKLWICKCFWNKCSILLSHCCDNLFWWSLCINWVIMIMQFGDYHFTPFPSVTSIIAFCHSNSLSSSNSSDHPVSDSYSSENPEFRHIPTNIASKSPTRMPTWPISPTIFPSVLLSPLNPSNSSDRQIALLIQALLFRFLFSFGLYK